MRNRIYEYIVADRKTRRFMLHHYPYPARPFKDCQSSRPYLGLTQVNQLLRTEFQPLYICKPTLYLPHVAKYLETFPLQDQALSRQLSQILRALARKTDNLRPPGIDILPLLKVDWQSLPFRITNADSKLFVCRDSRALDLTYVLITAMVVRVPQCLWDGTITAIGVGLRHHKQPFGMVVTLSLRTAFTEDALSAAMLPFLQNMSFNVYHGVYYTVECRNAGLKYSWKARAGQWTIELV
jgi:hypothetical protein